MQLSHGVSPHISLSCPNIQTRYLHIFCRHTASTYAFFPLPLIDGTIQPSHGICSCHILTFSLVTKLHVLQDIPGIPGILLPLPYQDGSPRGLCSLLSGPYGRHSLENCILGWQPFDFCQGRAEIPSIWEKSQMELMIICPSRIFISVLDEMSSKQDPRP